MNKLYTAQEVAERLKIKKTTVYELIKRGELESSKIGKQLRISEEQLSRYFQKGSASPQESSISFPGFQPESSLLKRDYLLYSNGLIISGQTSPALEYLIEQMSVHPSGLPVLHSHLNTYNGLYSLYFKKVHATTAGILPEHIPALLPGISTAALLLYEYDLGFYVQKENPRDISFCQRSDSAGDYFCQQRKGKYRENVSGHPSKRIKYFCRQNQWLSERTCIRSVYCKRSNQPTGRYRIWFRGCCFSIKKYGFYSS